MYVYILTIDSNLNTTQLAYVHLQLVVCLSTNGERALNYTIVTTNTQATKIK